MRPTRTAPKSLALALFVASAGAASAAGCSVLVNPDLSLLEPGGGDAGRDASRDGGMCTGTCDDRIACTIDSCETATNRCVSVPDNSRCAAGLVCDEFDGCITQRCTSNAQCDNGNACDGVETCSGGSCRAGVAMTCDDGRFCNGTETCDPDRGCVAGRAPACDDNDRCTMDSCNPSASGGVGACQSVPIEGCGSMAPPNDSCARATEINLMSGSMMVSGTTAGATNDVRSTCGGVGGDVWYAITYPGRLDLEIVASPVSTADPVLSVRESCAGNDLACNDDAAFGSRASRMWIRSDGRASSRTLYVAVDAFTTDAEGPFTLRATTSPAVAGNACGEGMGGGLFDVSRGGTVLHAMPTRMSRTQGRCTPTSTITPEETYLFTGAMRQTAVQVSARGLTPSVYVRTGSCSGTELNCVNAAGTAVTFTHPGGSSFLYVDNLPPTTPYALTVRGVMP